jgi:hypothetical protein
VNHDILSDSKSSENPKYDEGVLLCSSWCKQNVQRSKKGTRMFKYIPFPDQLSGQSEKSIYFSKNYLTDYF